MKRFIIRKGIHDYFNITAPDGASAMKAFMEKYPAYFKGYTQHGCYAIPSGGTVGSADTWSAYEWEVM